MRFYPRGIRKELRDEYRADLSPTKALFRDFKNNQAAGHDVAFERSEYERRFELSEQAMEHLDLLAGISEGNDVYLICQCQLGQRCHREMLLLLAQKKFDAPIDTIYNEYSCWVKRLETFKAA